MITSGVSYISFVKNPKQTAFMDVSYLPVAFILNIESFVWKAQLTYIASM